VWLELFDNILIIKCALILKDTLKHLSQARWILILKIKTNQNKQQYFTDNNTK